MQLHTDDRMQVAQLVCGHAKMCPYTWAYDHHTFKKSMLWTSCRYWRYQHVHFATQVEVAAAGDDNSAAARVEQELLQVRKKKGGLKVGAWFSVLCAEYRSSYYLYLNIFVAAWCV